MGALPRGCFGLSSQRSQQQTPWHVERVRGRAGQLHGLGIGDPVVRRLRWCDPITPALVLGRAQPTEEVDVALAASLGWELVRRTSGGGAVLVVPGAQLWADLVVPATDPLADPDVGRAALWLGETWSRALVSLGVAPASLGVHRGPMAGSPRVCFAALAAGEVTVAGRKLVGIAARRARLGALFQCAVPLHWDARDLAQVMRTGDLGGVAIGLADLGHPTTLESLAVAFQHILTGGG